MKKLLLSIGLAVVLALGAFAETPKYFTITIGSMVTRDFAKSTTAPSIPFGMQYQFDKTFSGGFRFDAANSNLTLLDISVSPIENAYLTLYAGGTDANVAFGLGLGYDFLSTNDRLFSSMGVYFDWIATNETDNLSNGGALSLGLKTKFGM